MTARAETIAAIATPPGPARRGILRLSGPAAGALARRVLRDDEPRFDARAERLLVRARFDDGRGTQPVFLLWMRGPRSYTREDVAEFHLPGAAPLLAAALERVLALGARAAEPGEFTRRAFLNGRIDLARAEGVLALTRAGNEAERAAAALLLDGGLSRFVAEIRSGLLELLALCEASLDFDESETGHVPSTELAAAWADVRARLADALAWELARAAPSALARVVLVGAPSAGKSTLWNALTGGHALTSPIPGTTRDALVAPWELGSTTCLLIDGPGLEPAPAGPAVKAQELFARVREQADLCLWVVAATEPSLAATPEPCGDLLVWSKIDLVAALPALPPSCAGLPAVAVSARHGIGFDGLARAVAQALAGEADAPTDGGVARLLLARHRAALVRARDELEAAGELLRAHAPLDLVAEALRGALGAVDELSGRTSPEEVLDHLFARFCLGK